MGLKIFKIGDEREALELKCDSPTPLMRHRLVGLIAVRTPAILHLQ
jgi:hypothetical protein